MQAYMNELKNRLLNLFTIVDFEPVEQERVANEAIFVSDELLLLEYEMGWETARGCDLVI